MKHRITLWASCGFLIAGSWAVYFALAAKDYPIAPIVYILARLTQPIALVMQHSALSVYWVLFANVVTYALAGLIVETLRRLVKHSQ